MATDTTDIIAVPDEPAKRIPTQPPFIRRLRALTRRHRWQPLAVILLIAAFCNFYELQRNGFANLYYAAAIRSMLENWHNFFFVAFDPSGFVSVDKPPLGFWIQTASAKLLGYSGFSILLPEALAGFLSVAVLYALVRRIFGTVAGLLAALFLAITPISVVTSRNNTIDSLLVLTVLLAAYAISKAVEQGHVRWLLLAALLVGLGFNIKMLEAYLVVPAFALVYLLGVPLGWLKRLWHLAVAGVVMLVVSLSWVVAVDLTPAATRPYVGSSGSNSELVLALGYNGVQRLLGNFFNISISGSSSSSTAVGGPGGVSENGAQGIFRLLNAELGGQASWLLALGIVGIFAAGWGMRPRGFLCALPEHLHTWRHSSAARQAAHLAPAQSVLVLWGMWTLTEGVFFSVAGFYHRYYLSMLAPGIAALAGIGVVLLWRDYRAHGWRVWLLPVALVVTALAQAVILADYSGWNSWMTPLIVGGSLLVAAALIAYHLLSDRSEPGLPASLLRWTYAPLLAVVLGVALLLVGPVTWFGVSLAAGAGGTLPAAGPTATLAQTSNSPTNGFGSGRGNFPEGFQPGSPPLSGTGGPGFGGAPTSPPVFRGGQGGGAGAGSTGQELQVDSQLLAYLEAHQGSAKYLFATLSSQTAAPYIIVSGKAVLTFGGFNGSDQILTLAQLKTLIREGQVRYFLFSGGGFGGPGASGNSGNAQLTQWVEANCTQVSASTYSGSGTSSSGGALYVCTSATLSAANA